MSQVCADIRKINKLEQVNTDPLLSQFKYHFMIPKIICPKENQWENFIANAYKGKIQYKLGFKSQFVLPNSIYVIQIGQTYQNNYLADIMIGFRRDDVAIKIAREIKQFQFGSKVKNIQICYSFGLFLDKLNSKFKKQQQQMMKQINGSGKNNDDLLQSTRKKSASKDRERSRQKKDYQRSKNGYQRSADKIERQKDKNRNQNEKDHSRSQKHKNQKHQKTYKYF